MHTREQNSEVSNEKLALQFSHGLRNLFNIFEPVPHAKSYVAPFTTTKPVQLNYKGKQNEQINRKLEQSYSPHAFAQPVQVDFNTLSDCKKFAVDESTVCTFSVEIN